MTSEQKPRSIFRRYWPAIRLALTLLFFGAVCVLVALQIRKVDWSQVSGALRAYRLGTLLTAIGLAALSYGVYSCFDLIGRRYVGAKLSVPRVMSTGFVSYVFNQNLGSIIGAFAFRFRLYSRFGLDSGEISRIVGMSMLTNWLGYAAIAGTVFAMNGVKLPSHWAVGQGVLRIIGVALLCLAAAYLTVCAASKRREFTLRGNVLRLPSLRMAVTQLLLSMSHWPTTAAVMYVLLQHKIDYPSVLGTMLLSAVAAVMTHIPAGLGVLEAVCVALLSSRIAYGELLAAILAFRAVFYLLPFAVAGLMYLGMEAEAKAKQTASTPASEQDARVREASSCASR